MLAHILDQRAITQIWSMGEYVVTAIERLACESTESHTLAYTVFKDDKLGYELFAYFSLS